MTKYTIVNQKTCIACGTCGEICPSIFGYLNSGEAYVKIDNNEGIAQIPQHEIEDVEDAVFNCPSNSIKLLEEPLQKEKDVV